jgi:CheY-like chemotaxis protein
MHAVVLHGPSQKSWDEVPDPKLIDDTDVLFRGAIDGDDVTSPGSYGPSKTGPSTLGTDGRPEQAPRMEPYMRNVLVVESDPVERERLAAALEGDGFEIVLCPGPTAPDYRCIGARLGRCPLATHRCIVVLDMDQDGDAAVHGTSADELLDFYLEGQHPVVTLNSRPTAAEGDRILRLRRHPETDVLLTAVWSAASPTAAGHQTEPNPALDQRDVHAADGRVRPSARPSATAPGWRRRP